MQYLNWELSVLHRAVAFPNLSHASANIGISQPQLSRVVAKLESELGLNLLDREIKRKASWTQEAYKLADIYSRTVQRFQSDLTQIKDSSWPRVIRIGLLEGLIPSFIKVLNHTFTHTDIKTAQIYVYDTSKLEERFLENDLDLIYSFRVPNKKKFKHVKNIAYQLLEHHSSEKATSYTLSEFEYTSQQYKQDYPNMDRNIPLIISNSLSFRKEWHRVYSATAILPSEPYKIPKKTENELKLYVIAHDLLPQKLWDIILEGFGC